MPPATRPTPDVREDDRRRLASFLDALRELLEVSLYQFPELFGQHTAAFQAQWPAVRDRFLTVNNALLPLNEVPSRDRGRLAKQLEDHGLTDGELTLKLDVFSNSLLMFLDEVDRREDAEVYWKAWAARLEGPEPTGGVLRRAVVRRIRGVLAGTRRVLRGGLRQVLGAADVLLESVGDAVSFLPGPKAAAAGIKEFKEAAEVVLTEPEEAERAARRSQQGASGSKPPTLATLRWSASQLNSVTRQQ